LIRTGDLSVLVIGKDRRMSQAGAHDAAGGHRPFRVTPSETTGGYVVTFTDRRGNVDRVLDILFRRAQLCVAPPPPEEPPAPPVVEPPPPPPPACDPSLPSDVFTSTTAGPYTVTKSGATSLSATKPDGGLNVATEFDVEVGGTGYGFTKGASVPWFQLIWTDIEVRVENWEHFAGKAITAVQFYQ
jgi:hypothetical protein